MTNCTRKTNVSLKIIAKVSTATFIKNETKIKIEIYCCIVKQLNKTVSCLFTIKGRK